MATRRKHWSSLWFKKLDASYVEQASAVDSMSNLAADGTAHGVTD